MPAARTATEAKQFLGLIGYYRKFIPWFTDISIPLTSLTRHNITFDWMEQCQKAFNHLHKLLMEYPILQYLHLMQGYILYTDASGIDWSGVLTQEYHVTDAEVTIRSDHLPLKKFVNKQTMNSKVNNWVVELEQFRLHLEWIPGSWNLLADSLSHLIDVVPDAQQPDEPKDHGFGSYCFEELEQAKVFKKVSKEVIETQAVTSKGVECLLELWESPEVEGVVLNY